MHRPRVILDVPPLDLPATPTPDDIFRHEERGFWHQVPEEDKRVMACSTRSIIRPVLCLDDVAVPVVWRLTDALYLNPSAPSKDVE